eukprot:5575475-Pleurochrysis_carterae.AAC.1
MHVHTHVCAGREICKECQPQPQVQSQSQPCPQSQSHTKNATACAPAAVAFSCAFSYAKTTKSQQREDERMRAFRNRPCAVDARLRKEAKTTSQDVDAADRGPRKDASNATRTDTAKEIQTDKGTRYRLRLSHSEAHSRVSAPARLTTCHWCLSGHSAHASVVHAPSAIGPLCCSTTEPPKYLAAKATAAAGAAPAKVVLFKSASPGEKATPRSIGACALPGGIPSNNDRAVRSTFVPSTSVSPLSRPEASSLARVRMRCSAKSW